MLFTPDPSKPAQEVLFSRPILDKKLDFKQHIDSAISRVNKSIFIIKKLRYNLPRKSLITIYQAFSRPSLIVEISSTTNLKMIPFLKN